MIKQAVVPLPPGSVVNFLQPPTTPQICNEQYHLIAMIIPLWPLPTEQYLSASLYINDAASFSKPQPAG